MLHRYDELSEESIGAVAFANASHAVSLLRAMAGNNITDSAFERLLPSLISALTLNPDPDRALANLAAWLDGVGSRAMYFDLLGGHPAALDALLTVFACSQFLADIVIRTPEYFEVLANPRIRDRSRTMEDYLADARRRIGVASTPGKRLDALRRFKAPEVLRIGVRDILGYAALDETIAEISDFAEACVRAAVEICGAGDGFAVIGVGKLGARELNYASDIDLIFVHEDSLPQATANKLGEAVRDALAKPTEAGFVFRVDLRLRPEGRFGALSRSLSGCRNYYESWAEPWERQALLKARFVGGDQATGAQFIDLARQFVYRKMVTAEFVESVRENKRLMEAQTARAGEAQSNVKQGVGGIRDIEFAVQLLELIAGGQHPDLRVAATLSALDSLATLGLINTDERDMLAESYRFLRNVEHRLQIMDERPVRTLPLASKTDLDLFGRRLGYSDGVAFMTDYNRHADRVNKAFREMFYGETGSAVVPSDPGATAADREIVELVLSPDDDLARGRLTAILSDRGFSNPVAAAELLRSSETGSDYGEIGPEARERFAALSPLLIAGASATDDPDGALAGFDRLSVATPSRAALYSALLGEPGFLIRLLILAAQAPGLWQTVLGHLEYLDLLGDESQLDLPSGWPDSADAGGVGRAVRRERVRIAARDLWGVADTPTVMADLTALATSALTAALKLPEFADTAPQVALIGMGKLGGGELGYGSDLDVLWVVAEADSGDLPESHLPAFRRSPPPETGGKGRVTHRQRLPDFRPHQVGHEAATGSTPEIPSSRSPLFLPKREEKGAWLDADGASSSLFRDEEAHEAVAWVSVERAAAYAKRVMAFIGSDLAPYGAAFEIDARLRPDGRVGVLARTVVGYERYLNESAQTWEKQALIKARFIAGNAELGAQFEAMARSVVYGQPLTDAQAEELRHMKRRIETERCKDPLDIKLGPGGLSDIEWTTQFLQWRNGQRWSKAQAPGTLPALAALRDAAVIRQEYWETLSETYIALTKLRNRQWLANGHLPQGANDSIVTRRAQVRAIFERLFMG